MAPLATAATAAQVRVAVKTIEQHLLTSRDL